MTVFVESQVAEVVTDPALTDGVIYRGTGTWSRIVSTGEVIYRATYRKQVYDVVFPPNDGPVALWVACVIS